MRNRPDHKIDELFQEAFKDFNPEPPGNVWNKIQDSVSSDSGSNKKGFWFKNRIILSASAVIIIAAGFSSVFFTDLLSSSSEMSAVSEKSNLVDYQYKPVVTTNEIENEENTEIIVENNLNDSNFEISRDELANNPIAIEQKAAIQKSEDNANQNSTPIAGNFLKSESANENISAADPDKEEIVIETVFVQEKSAENIVLEKFETLETKEIVVEKTSDDNPVISEETNTTEIVVMVNDNNQVSVVESDLSNLPVVEQKEEVSHNFNAYVKESNSTEPDLKENKIDTLGISEIILPTKTAKNYTPGKFEIGLHYTNENLYQLSKSKFLTDKSYRMGGNSFDISINFKLNEKLTLGTGIGYTSYRENVYFNVDAEKTVIVDSIYTSSGWEYITETEEVSYSEQLTNTYSFVRLPLYLRYKLAELDRFSFHLTGGAVFSQIMDKREKILKYPGDLNVLSSERITPFQSNYSFLLVGGLNAHYKLSNFVTLGMDLLFKRNITDYYEISTMEMRTPYSVGARASVYFNF
jgi:hypothetical protein